MRTSRYLLLALVAGVIAADGYLGGVWGGRSRRELDEAAARLPQVPLAFGDWKGESLALDPKLVEMAGFSGYTVRRYENRRSGAVVNVLLACGRPGPLSVHTPEVCFGGAGFELNGDTTPFAPDDSPGTAEFFKATFDKKDSPAPEKLRALWSWNKNGVWRVADNPRWTFAGTPVLYKLYVTQEFYPRDDATDGAGCADFLRDFLPLLEPIVKPAP
jgi:hypothetical protein